MHLRPPVQALLGQPSKPASRERDLLDGTRDTAAALTSACQDWLDRLSGRQRAVAAHPAPPDGDHERLRWFFTPTDHGGLPLGRQQPHQQRAAMRLLASGLSEAAYVTVTTVMGLENVLDRLEGWSVNVDRDRGRDPAMYFVSVFGRPGSALWGWRFGGHHVSVNQLVKDGRLVSTTPFFLGADPAAAPLIGGVLRPLASVEDLALDLAKSLDPEQFHRARLHVRAVPDVVGGNRTRLRDGDTRPPAPQLFRALLEDQDDAAAVRRLETDMAARAGYGPDDEAAVALTDAPAGLPGSSLSRDQAQDLAVLLDQHFDRAPAPVADLYRGRHSAPGRIDDVSFAWAGERRPGEPHYYRIQGPGLLIEYDNTQRHANHAHSVWRDPHGDFGLDVLARHHASHEHA